MSAASSAPAPAKPQLDLLAPPPAAQRNRLKAVAPTPAPQPVAAQKLWLCLRFAQLPLEICAGYDPEEPAAVTEIDGQRVRVTCVSPAAAALKIQPGMTRSEAQALCPTLRLEPRDPDAESRTLNTIATWCGRFTTWVSVAASNQILLEVGGSKQLFGSVDALQDQAVAGLCQREHIPQTAIAPSATAAQWLAQWQPGAIVESPDDVRSALAQLPCDALALTVKQRARLARTGLHQLADLIRLPRDGLARRYGPRVLKQLDQALGLVPETLPAFQAPNRFTAEADMPLPSAQTPRLLAGAELLIDKLVQHLRAHDAAIDRFNLRLFHERQGATLVPVGLAVANRDGPRMLRLLGEHLDRTALPADVCSLRLEAPRVLPYSGGTIDALDDTGDDDWLATLERWQARLTPQKVTSISAVADHRPEHAWVAHPPGQHRPCTVKIAAPRPNWLLPEPQALVVRDYQPTYNGPLQIETGPERIEQGWWDHRADAHNQSGDVSRDYYVMRDRFGARLWVFQDRRKLTWWLHGHFV